MRGHSKTNGDQVKALGREMRATRRELNAKIDSVLALADRQVGIGGPTPAEGSPTLHSDRRPEPPAVRCSSGGALRPAGGPGFGVGLSKPDALTPSPILRTEDVVGTRFGLPYGPLAPVPQPPQDLPKDFVPQWAQGAAGTAVHSVPGTPVISGFITDVGEYNPELQGRQAVGIYEKMRRGDGQVEATLQALILPILSAEWKIEPAKPQDLPKSSRVGAGKKSEPTGQAKEVADFIRSNLFGGLEFRTSTGGWTSQTWEEVLENALLMLAFGVSVHEDVYTVDQGMIRLRMLADLLPITFYRWHVDDDGRTLLYLGQYGYRGARFEQVSVPADKITVFSFRREGANFWGRSVLRGAYPHWYVKNQLYRIEAIGAERNSIGVPVIIMPPGFSKEDHDAAVNFVTQLAAHERTGLVLPNGATFDILGVKGTMKDVQPIIRHHNEQISVQALATFLNLGRTQTGSRSLGQEANKFFMLALQSVAKKIASLIINTTIRRLVYYNYGLDAPVPKLSAANVQARALEDIIDALSKLGPAGAFVSDRPARNQIRKELGFADETVEGVVAIKGETVAEGKDTGEISGKGAEPVEESPAVGGSPRRQKSEAESQKSNAQASESRIPNPESRRSRRARNQVSPFWRDGHDRKLRMVAASEKHLDFPSHDREFTRSEQSIGKILRDAKNRTIRAIAAKMAEALKSSVPPSHITFEHDRQLEQRVLREVKKTYEFGRKQVCEEHARLKSRGSEENRPESRVPNPETPVLLADPADAASKKPGLIAEIAVNDYTNRLADAAKNIANDLRRTVNDDFSNMTAGEIADELFGAIGDYSEGLIDRAAQEASRGAMAGGRSDQLDEFQAGLEDAGGFYERTAILDKNTCAPCDAADGDQVAASEGPPPEPPTDSICEGGAECRCEWFEVMA